MLEMGEHDLPERRVEFEDAFDANHTVEFAVVGVGPDIDRCWRQVRQFCREKSSAVLLQLPRGSHAYILGDHYDVATGPKWIDPVYGPR